MAALMPPKRLPILCLAAALLGCAPTRDRNTMASAPLPPLDMGRLYEASSFEVAAVKDAAASVSYLTSRLATATAVAVDGDAVLTAAHSVASLCAGNSCFGVLLVPEHHDPDHSSFDVDATRATEALAAQWMRQRHDVAKLTVAGWAGEPLSVAAPPDVGGEPVFVIGHAKGYPKSIMPTHVVATGIDAGVGQGLIGLQHAVFDGHSGAAVVDRYGRLVAMVVARNSQRPELGKTLAIPVAAAQSAITQDNVELAQFIGAVTTTTNDSLRDRILADIIALGPLAGTAATQLYLSDPNAYHKLLGALLAGKFGQRPALVEQRLLGAPADGVLVSNLAIIAADPGSSNTTAATERLYSIAEGQGDVLVRLNAIDRLAKQQDLSVQQTRDRLLQAQYDAGVTADTWGESGVSYAVFRMRLEQQICTDGGPALPHGQIVDVVDFAAAALLRLDFSQARQSYSVAVAAADAAVACHDDDVDALMAAHYVTPIINAWLVGPRHSSWLAAMLLSMGQWSTTQAVDVVTALAEQIIDLQSAEVAADALLAVLAHQPELDVTTAQNAIAAQLWLHGGPLQLWAYADSLLLPAHGVTEADVVARFDLALQGDDRPTALALGWRFDAQAAALLALAEQSVHDASAYPMRNMLWHLRCASGDDNACSRALPRSFLPEVMATDFGTTP